MKKAKVFLKIVSFLLATTTFCNAGFAGATANIKPKKSFVWPWQEILAGVGSFSLAAALVGGIIYKKYEDLQLKTMKSELERAKKQGSANYSKLKRKYELMEAERKKIEADLKKSKNELERISTEKQEKHESLASYQAQLQARLDAAQGQLTELDRLREQLQSAESERKKLEGELGAANEEKYRKSSDYQSLASQQAQLQARLESAEKNSAELDDLRVRLQSAESERKRLEDELGVANAEKDQKSADYQSLVIQQAELQTRFEAEQEQLTELASIRDQLASTESERKKLEGELRTASSDYSELERQYKELEEKLKQAEDSTSALKNLCLFFDAFLKKADQDRILYEIIGQKYADLVREYNIFPISNYVDTANAIHRACEYYIGEKGWHRGNIEINKSINAIKGLTTFKLETAKDKVDFFFNIYVSVLDNFFDIDKLNKSLHMSLSPSDDESVYIAFYHIARIMLAIHTFAIGGEFSANIAPNVVKYLNRQWAPNGIKATLEKMLKDKEFCKKPHTIF